MNYYYITGTSNGIGKEIALQLLEDPQNKVTGLSRTNTLNHPNYTHIHLDLSDLTTVVNFKFPKHDDAKKIVLINNAGTLGDIEYMGALSSNDIISTYHINLVAPGILINQFIGTYNTANAEKIILNISSGAGKHPYDGWSIYCSSKAALDMLTQVAAEEQKNCSSQIKLYAVAPGKVDTHMQENIRKSSKSKFSRVEKFIEFKNDNELSSPVAIAKKYIQLLENPPTDKGVVFSIKA